jgi:hypothetical protein
VREIVEEVLTGVEACFRQVFQFQIRDSDFFSYMLIKLAKWPSKRGEFARFDATSTIQLKTWHVYSFEVTPFAAIAL